MGAFIDLTNKTFGKWTVVKQEGKKIINYIGYVNVNVEQ